MPAIYKDLYVEQRATFNETIIVNVSNLSGVTSGQIRNSYYSTNATASFSTTMNVQNSTVTLQMSANVTANVVAGRYVYDVIVSDTANNTITRILEGIVDVSPSVTR
jgi:hypothetical protein